MYNLFRNVIHTLPQSFHYTNIIEIIILTLIIYALLNWVKNTRAWTLLRGIAVIFAFVVVTYALDLTVLKWIVSRAGGVLLTIVVILFQPELRRVLEQLGRRNSILSIIMPSATVSDDVKRSAERLNNEIVKASFEMGREKTGALIVIEGKVALSEYERTGIPVDALVSSQLLVNIFQHNTPLHDGAVFINDDRIVAATCYLPLTDNMSISKDLGTRHRAGVGISEVSDSLTIIVSEETGRVSVARGGELTMNINQDGLKKLLAEMSPLLDDSKKKKKFRGFLLNEKKTNS